MNLNRTWTSNILLEWTWTKPEPLKYFEQELNPNPNRYLKRFDTLVIGVYVRQEAQAPSIEVQWYSFNQHFPWLIFLKSILCVKPARLEVKYWIVFEKWYNRWLRLLTRDVEAPIFQPLPLPPPSLPLPPLPLPPLLPKFIILFLANNMNKMH